MREGVFTVEDEVKYPYIEKMPDSLTRIHLNKNLYVEMNPQATPSIAIIEHSEPSSYGVESISFEWEYHNYPHNKTMRNVFGKIDLNSCGSGRLHFPGNFFISDDKTLSEIMDGYKRYNKIRKALNLYD